MLLPAVAGFETQLGGAKHAAITEIWRRPAAGEFKFAPLRRGVAITLLK
ncbi:hypothetical protein KCP76_18705 [Salmonella enterica subsp. enterica serovar Weltevreden]|nr:hypothetical protein KCP76_18705 [Salmonella enterica subsp. enterica serovar Weltevreden]